MARPVSDWDLGDLQGFIGMEEGSSLEFKRSDALAKTDSNKREMAKDVSAMANAAGGLIIYGIAESTGGVADYVDNGTDATSEWIDQVLSTNIEPKIPGLTIKRIPLNSGRSVYALNIPMAKTFAPHQSKPHKQYFRRYNNTILSMLDHEIRDLMRRSSSPDLFLRYIVHPVDLDQDMFKIIVSVGNNSNEPSLYTTIELAFDEKLTPPRGGVSPLTWQAVNIIAMSDSVTAVLYSKHLVVPNHMPIFREREFSIFDANIKISRNMMYSTAYRISCPGCHVERFGRVIRRENGDPVVDFQESPFLLAQRKD